MPAFLLMVQELVSCESAGSDVSSTEVFLSIRAYKDRPESVPRDILVPYLSVGLDKQAYVPPSSCHRQGTAPAEGRFSPSR